MAKNTTVLNKEYQLPNGETIMLGRERFMGPEILFNPALVDSEDPGLPEMIFNSIRAAPIDC